MAVTYAQLCDAVASVMAEVTAISRVQSYDDLTEGYPDLPLAQVYPESGDTDIRAGSADRSAFRGGSRVTETLVRVDIPCRQRSHLDLDMAAVLTVLEAVQNKLEEQDTQSYFGLAGIKGFHWRWERVNFEQGQTLYAGLRLSIWLRTF